MASRKGGSRAGSRNVFRKHARTKGKISLTRFFASFNVGDRAILKAEPAVNGNLYHRRHHGKNGVVVGQRGNCYEVQIKTGNKNKTIICHPVHLMKA